MVVCLKRPQTADADRIVVAQTRSLLSPVCAFAVPILECTSLPAPCWRYPGLEHRSNFEFHRPCRSTKAGEAKPKTESCF